MQIHPMTTAMFRWLWPLLDAGREIPRAFFQLSKEKAKGLRSFVVFNRCLKPKCVTSERSKFFGTYFWHWNLGSFF